MGKPLRFITAGLGTLALLFFAATAALSQEPAAPPAAPQTSVNVTGTVRTPKGVPVAGATVRLVHIPTGKGWVSWTDEDGRIDLSGVPAGRYRIEAQLIGFESATVEVDVATPEAPPFELVLRTATLAQIAAAAAPPPAPTPPPAANADAPATPSGTTASTEKSSDPAKPAQSAAAEKPPTPPAAPGARPQRGQQPGPPGQRAGATPNPLDALRQRLGQGGFQDVDPTGQSGGGAGEGPAGPSTSPAFDAGPLGDASSSDAFLISGTVGRGATSGGGFPGFGIGGFPGGGFPGATGGNPFPGGEGGAGGFNPQMIENLIFMAGQMGGAQGRGAQPGGRQPGQQGRRPGANQQGANQQGANQQGTTPPGGTPPAGQQATPPGGRPPQGGQPGQVQPGGFGQGMEALWGMQRLLRLAANRTRFGFYERFGHSAFDARPYSLTATDPTKISTWRSTFGANLGGPLKIPGIYNGTDKTFFFLNVDIGRQRNPVDTFSTVPLLEERAGDFSARGVQIYDPESNFNGPRTSFGTGLPADRLDPSALALLRFIPLPNLPGTVQNFHLQTRVPQASDRFGVRIIHTLTPKLNLQVGYNFNSVRSTSIQNFPDLTSQLSSRGQNVNLGLSQQWSPRFINDSRVNWTRQRTSTLNRFAFEEDVAGNAGITGISTDPRNWGVPMLNLTNFSDVNDPVPALRRNQTLRITDNMTFLRAKHTWRIGGEIRRLQVNSLNDPTPRGNFSFTGLMSSQLEVVPDPDNPGQTMTVPVAGTGWDFADFLLGYAQSTSVRFGSSSTYLRAWGFSAYIQDDWRIHPRFSLTWGLRYDLTLPFYELFDRLATLGVNDSRTAVSLVLPSSVTVFSGPVPRSILRPDYNNFGPRIAIAWRPKPTKWWKYNTTIRAGYSMFYNASAYNQVSNSILNQPPFAQAQTLQTSADQILTLQNGFPPGQPAVLPNTLAVDPDYRMGRAEIWNFSVESELRPGLALTLNYTGTKGSELDRLLAPNRCPPGTSVLECEANREIGNATGFTYNISGANSIYHALQTSVRRRMTRGLMLQGTYTWGHSIDDASSIGGGQQIVVQDENNLAAERGRSSFDIRHQFQFMGVYELPFGQRKRWARSGRASKILSDWQMTGNLTVRSGAPFTARLLGSAANNSGTGGNNSERPNQIADARLPWGQRDPLRFFNTAAFVLPPPGTFGNAGRNTIPGPGSWGVNFSFGRFVRFGKDGQRRLDLRWQVQNLFNHPNFTGLNTIVNSSQFGRVQGAGPMRTMEFTARVNF